MYGGRVVETGGTDQVLTNPRHRYTAGLIATSGAISLDSDRSRAELPSIPGQVPAAGAFPAGCPFRNRCAHATEECETVPPLKQLDDHLVACWNPA
jgi:peptide/nickel transport system ATP-binding protein